MVEMGQNDWYDTMKYSSSEAKGSGASINYVNKQGERGLAECQRYYISLCSKLVNEGGGAQWREGFI